MRWPPEGWIRDALRIWRQGVHAVQPRSLLPTWLIRRGRTWRVGNHVLTPPIYALAVGKAASCMMAVVEKVLREDLVKGLVVTKHGHTREDVGVPQIEASHPVPDITSLQAGEALLRFVQQVPPHGTLLVLLSGGASALVEVLRSPLTLEDLASLTHLMLLSGLNIYEMNAVRKHISEIKGGQLLRYIRGRVVTLAMSDVVGDDPATIGSGPTVVDPTTCDDARQALVRHGLWERVPDRVRVVLKTCKETLKPGDPLLERSVYHIIGSNREMLLSASKEALRLGYQGGVLSATVDGTLEEASRMMKWVVREVLESGHPWSLPAFILMGGEVTLVVQKEGYGGRAMHFAVQTASRLPVDAPVVVLGASSDGTDGPTDGAGGVMIPSWRKVLDPTPFLEGFQSYRYLERVGGLLRTGPTCTNVGDLYLALIAPSS